MVSATLNPLMSPENKTRGTPTNIPMVTFVSKTSMPVSNKLMGILITAESSPMFTLNTTLTSVLTHLERCILVPGMTCVYASSVLLTTSPVNPLIVAPINPKTSTAKSLTLSPAENSLTTRNSPRSTLSRPPTRPLLSDPAFTRLRHMLAHDQTMTSVGCMSLGI